MSNEQTHRIDFGTNGNAKCHIWMAKIVRLAAWQITFMPLHARPSRWPVFCVVCVCVCGPNEVSQELIKVDSPLHCLSLARNYQAIVQIHLPHLMHSLLTRDSITLHSYIRPSGHCSLACFIHIWHLFIERAHCVRCNIHFRIIYNAFYCTALILTPFQIHLAIKSHKFDLICQLALHTLYIY